MISSEKLKVYFDLQQSLLNSDDNKHLLANLLPKIYKGIPELEDGHGFISVLFIDSKFVVSNAYFVSAEINEGGKDLVEKVLNLNKVFDPSSGIESELLWGSPFVSADVNNFINATHPMPGIKSLIFSPLKIGKKLSGVAIFGSVKTKSEVSQDDWELIRIITSLIGLAFQIQDTDTSLTTITQQVYQMNAKLHELDKLKDDFVSVASHELRTPMTAIRSYAWMALYKSDVPLSEKLKKYLSRTLISTERLIVLVNDMLNISRIESGRVAITPQVIDMVALCKDVLVEVTPKSKEKNLQLSIAESVIPKVFADPDKVRQVLLNLIGNSMKFTPANGPINISFFSDGQLVETKISDGGVGISKDDLSRLFLKFGRLDNSYVAASASGGTGLGLYICRSLIDLMKGRIWATSEGTGKGAQFIFSLPIATQEILSQAQNYTTLAEGEAKPLEPVII